jgi:zinc protease
MVNLALTPKQVETERDVVAEERLSAVEDSVEGLLDEMMHLQAFKTHPYRFPVIGLMKDIKAVTPEKAERFYRTYYAPNNAVIVVAGKLEEKAHARRHPQGLRQARESHLPAESASPSARPSSPCAARWCGRCPPIASWWGSPRPALAEADRPAYELLAELLVGGPSVAPLPAPGGGEGARLLRDGRGAAHARSGALRHLGADDQGPHHRRGEALIEPELSRIGAEPIPAAELDKGARAARGGALGGPHLERGQGRAPR